LGILSDIFFGRIPFPNEKNTSRLFDYMDENNDQKIDINEFGIYLVKLFHAHSIEAFIEVLLKYFCFVLMKIK
jgi:hypothetical protein